MLVEAAEGKLLADEADNAPGEPKLRLVAFDLASIAPWNAT